MITHIPVSTAALAAVVIVASLGGCGTEFTHVKPGQSARQYLKEKNAPPTLVAAAPGGAGIPENATPNASGPLIPPPLPDINPLPALPDTGDTSNRVADAYAHGSFAMQAGKDAEAIFALEEAVRLDPNFTEAWTKLVKLYERTGNPKKAAEAYKKLKGLGQPNGTNDSGTAPGGLGLIR
jgi:hypothetical protein